MTLKVRKRNGKYRLTEMETGRVAKNKNGKPVDGGGHEDEVKAHRQAAYILSSEDK